MNSAVQPPPVVSPEQIRRQNEEEAQWFAQHRNNRALKDYLFFAKEWGESQGRSRKPAVPIEEEARVVKDDPFTFELRPNGRPLSTVKPEDFLPVFRTDVGAVDHVVGAPVAAYPGLHELTSSVYPYLGQVHTTAANVQYVCVPSPGSPAFGRNWRKLA